jgi:hypothetical protein
LNKKSVEGVFKGAANDRIWIKAPASHRAVRPSGLGQFARLRALGDADLFAGLLYNRQPICSGVLTEISEDHDVTDRFALRFILV